jgi:transposase InsO family protein
MPLKDASLISGMRKYSALYPRFGARRVRVFLQRDGMTIERDRAARIWAVAGLQVPTKRGRKRYRSNGCQPFVATAPNQVWAYDFVFDGCANGQKLKCLKVVDEFGKELVRWGGWLDPEPTSDCGIRAVDRRARLPISSEKRQRHRICQLGADAMGSGKGFAQFAH